MSTKQVSILLLIIIIIIIIYAPFSYGEEPEIQGSFLDTFTDQDHAVLNSYRENDLDKKIENISILFILTLHVFGMKYMLTKQQV